MVSEAIGVETGALGEGGREAQEVAKNLGIPLEAAELALDCEIIDLHLDTFIPVRLFGYDVYRRHGLGVLRGCFFGHLDLPRAQAGGLTGGCWSITTNPFRSRRGRWRAFERNLKHLSDLVVRSSGAVRIVKTASEYASARSDGAHAVFLAVQGGNCFEGAPEGILSVPDGLITRVTVVHLTNSVYGASSSPVSQFRPEKGLTPEGRDFVRALNEARVFVDLAHIHPDGFKDAVEVHDQTQPLIVTHTGVSGVNPHWRNLDDAQIKAVAKTGGTIGVIYSAYYLKGATTPDDGRMVVDHMEHIIRVAGEDFVSIGTDYDGAITPPHDFKSANSYPRLVAYMLERGWSPERIQKILAGNYLRALKLLRP